MSEAVFPFHRRHLISTLDCLELVSASVAQVNTSDKRSDQCIVTIHCNFFFFSGGAVVVVFQTISTSIFIFVRYENRQRKEDEAKRKNTFSFIPFRIAYRTFISMFWMCKCVLVLASHSFFSYDSSHKYFPSQSLSFEFFLFASFDSVAACVYRRRRRRRQFSLVSFPSSSMLNALTLIFFCSHVKCNQVLGRRPNDRTTNGIGILIRVVKAKYTKMKQKRRKQMDFRKKKNERTHT